MLYLIAASERDFQLDVKAAWWEALHSTAMHGGLHDTTNTHLSSQECKTTRNVDYWYGLLAYMNRTSNSWDKIVGKVFLKAKERQIRH